LVNTMRFTLTFRTSLIDLVVVEQSKIIISFELRALVFSPARKVHLLQPPADFR